MMASTTSTGFMTFMFMMLSGLAMQSVTVQGQALTSIYSMTLPTKPEMTLSVLEDATTKDMTVELVMDANNKYTSLMEIGDLLQGKIMSADVRVSGFRTVDGVAMPEQVLLEMENVGPMIMAMVMNPSSSETTAMFEEPLKQFMTNAMATLPSTEDTVFWQALSTALQRWITQNDNRRARQLLVSAAAAAATAGGQLRGF